MASYTMELRKVIEYFGREEVENWFKDYDLSHYLTPTQIEQITKFNVWSKDRLAEKIVDNYYMREIGFETPALFKHYAKIEMKKIMERYLPKIYSNFLEYDPLSNVDFTETYTREIAGQTQNQGTSNSTSQNNASGLNVNSDTPQGQISKQAILGGSYASQTNASETESEIEDNTTTENQGTSNTIETFTRHEEGDNGVIITNQRLVKEYREIIVAIDEEIINELNCLFMGIY
mgnify:CR=1 FL=1|jgi:hypothetical protein